MMHEMPPAHCTQKCVNFDSLIRTNFGPAFPTLWPHVLACWSAAAGWSAAAAAASWSAAAAASWSAAAAAAGWSAAAAWCSAAAAGWSAAAAGWLLLLGGFVLLLLLLLF